MRTLGIGLIITLFLITAYFFFERAANTPVANDDLVYAFMVDNTHDTPYQPGSCSRHISGIGDILDSQYNHYFIYNGRSIVHFFVQLFCGLLPAYAFYITAALIIFLSIYLFGLFTLNAQARFNPLAWLLIMIAFFALWPYQGGGMYVKCLLFNYYYPLLLVLCILLLFRRFKRANYRFSARMKFAIVPLAFLIGWSHESYAFPLLGALIILAIIERKLFTADWLYFLIPMALGAVILLCAPGNYTRYAGGLSPWIMFKCGIEYHFYCPLNYALLIVAAIAFIRDRKGLFSLLRENMICVIGLILSSLFCCVAFTSMNCMYGQQMYAALLTFLILNRLCPMKKFSVLNAAIFLTLAIAFVSYLTTTNAIINKLSQSRKELIKNYCSSKDGRIKYNKPSYTRMEKIFVTDYYEITDLEMQSYNLYYFNGAKPLTIEEINPTHLQEH